MLTCAQVADDPAAAVQKRSAMQLCSKCGMHLNAQTCARCGWAWAWAGCKVVLLYCPV